MSGGFKACGRYGRFGRFGRRPSPRGRTTITSKQAVKTRLPLAYQILVFQAAIILLSALIGAAAAVWQASQELDRQSEQRSLAIAESVASNASIQQALLAGDPGAAIQQTAETIRRSTSASYVVVTDARGIRYSHPNAALIGKPVDEDPGPVLAGQTWVGVQRGTLGVSARGKAPIFDQGQVIGMVSVGFLEPPLAERLLGELPGFATSLLPSLAIGVIASWVLAWRLKRQTFGLEPYEIAGLLEEREASLQGIHEGAIATDSDGTITLANDEARRLLMLPDNCVGRKVAQVLPQGRLLKFLSGGLKDEDEVLLAGERVLVASRRAILVRGREIGHVATLRDTTELTGLARGLGVDSLTDALRAQAHEFANRLHTIAGLMQMGRVADAMELAHAIGEARVVLAQLRQHVERRHIVGLVVGDALQARDLRHGAQRRGSELAHALGDRVDHREDCARLIVEHEVVVAEVRAGDVPVEVLGLQIEREDVGAEHVQRRAQVARRRDAETVGSVQLCGAPRCGGLVGLGDDRAHEIRSFIR